MQQGTERVTAFTEEGTHAQAFEFRDWALLVGSGMVWGASFIFIAMGLEAFHPAVVTLGRISFGAITLGMFSAARTAKIDRGDWPRLVVISITWLAFPMAAFPIAQQHISSGVAGMLNGSVPVFSAVLASVALRRLPGTLQIVGLLVGGVGIVLLGLPAIGDGGASAGGVVLLLVACLNYAIASNVTIPVARKYGSIPIIWRAQLIALVLLAPYWMWGLTKPVAFTWSSMLALIALGAGGTALAFLAFVALSDRVGATRAAGLTYVEAVVALLLGTIVLSEPVRILEVIGCAVLLTGAWLLSRDDSGALPDA